MTDVQYHGGKLPDGERNRSKWLIHACQTPHGVPTTTWGSSSACKPLHLEMYSAEKNATCAIRLFLVGSRIISYYKYSIKSYCTGLLLRWGRVLIIMLGRSRLTIDPRIPTMPRRSRPRRVFTDQADIASTNLVTP